MSIEEALKVVEWCKKSKLSIRGRQVEVFFSKLARIGAEYEKSDDDNTGDNKNLPVKPKELIELLKLDRKLKPDSYFVADYGWDMEMINMDLAQARIDHPLRDPSPIRDEPSRNRNPPQPCHIVFIPHLPVNAVEADLQDLVRNFPGSTSKVFMFCQANIRHGFIEFVDVKSAGEFINSSLRQPLSIQGKRVFAEFSRRNTLEPRLAVHARALDRFRDDDRSSNRRLSRSRSRDRRRTPPRHWRDERSRSRSRSRQDREPPRRTATSHISEHHYGRTMSKPVQNYPYPQQQPFQQQSSQPAYYSGQAHLPPGTHYGRAQIVPQAQPQPQSGQAPVHPLLRLRGAFGAPSQQY